jgi:hypothetical protein
MLTGWISVYAGRLAMLTIQFGPYVSSAGLLAMQSILTA